MEPAGCRLTGCRAGCEGNPAKGAEGRAHDDQGLAATAGRSVHKASRLDNTSHWLPESPAPKPRPLTGS